MSHSPLHWNHSVILIMTKDKYSLRIIIRYSILQLPELALILALLILVQRWITITLWVLSVIIFLWVIKDIVLFFFTWPSYDWDQKDIMTGKIGEALENIDPEGVIIVHGEKWKAVSEEDRIVIEKGRKVEVTGRNGLVLMVKPVHEDDTPER